MTLQDMLNRITRTLPQAASGTIQTPSIISELNHGIDEINLIARCWKKTLSFSLPASTAWTEFSLSQAFPNYLGIDKTGLWFFDQQGSSHYIYAKTKRWLDIYIRNWRDNQGVSVPTWSYIRGDLFAFYPYVNVSGCVVSADCLVSATPMTNPSNYPWTNGATQVTALRMFDNAICSYAIWKLAPAVFDKEGRNTYEQEFMADVKVATAQFNNREDMTSDIDYYLRPDIVGGGGFLPR